MKGVWLVLATAVISGFSIFLNKFGVSGLDPAVFTTTKNVLVALFLITTILVMKEWQTIKALSKKQWAQLATIGLIGGSIPFLLFFNGLAMTSAAQAGMIHKSMFLWVALLAAFTLKEKISKNMILGGVLLLLGNLLLLKLTNFVFGVGDLLILGATLLWAGEITLSKYVLNDLPGRVVAAGRMGFGALYLLAYLAFTNKLILVASMTSSFWWIAITGVLLYGYVFTFYEGLKLIPASTATAILLVATVITTVLNLLWTGNIVWQQVLGSVILLGGVATFINLPEMIKQRISASS